MRVKYNRKENTIESEMTESVSVMRCDSCICSDLIGCPILDLAPQ